MNAGLKTHVLSSTIIWKSTRLIEPINNLNGGSARQLISLSKPSFQIGTKRKNNQCRRCFLDTLEFPPLVVIQLPSLVEVE